MSRPTRHRRGRLKELVIAQLIENRALAIRNNPALLDQPDPAGETPFDTRVLLGYLVDWVIEERNRAAHNATATVKAVESHGGRLHRLWLARHIAPDDLRADLDTLDKLHDAMVRASLATVEPGRGIRTRRLTAADLVEVAALAVPEAYVNRGIRHAWAEANWRYPTRPDVLLTGEAALLATEERLAFVVNFALDELYIVSESDAYQRAYHTERTNIYKSVASLEAEGILRRDRESRERVYVGFTRKGFEERARAPLQARLRELNATALTIDLDASSVNGASSATLGTER